MSTCLLNYLKKKQKKLSYNHYIANFINILYIMFLGVPSPELPELVTTKTNVYTQQHNNNKTQILNKTIIQTKPEQTTAV